jgi:hypothetical protein
MDSENDRQLASFMGYCYAHPEQRFWQALCNWADVHAVLVRPLGGVQIIDTYYLKDNKGLQAED